MHTKRQYLDSAPVAMQMELMLDNMVCLVSVESRNSLEMPKAR